MRSRSWATSGILALCLSASTGLAQDASDTDATPDRAIVEVEGQEGLWFRLDVAQRILASVEQLPRAKAHIELLEKQLALHESLEDQQALLVANADETARAAQSAMLPALRRAHDAEIALHARCHSRLVWVAVGALAALLVGGTVIVAL